ncbi:hypothetical protein C8J56DRAFT_174318 [Mycena floridula]|nr:hypothetical protein C8J56DRAFT_174318 [Mycena floridula]
MRFFNGLITTILLAVFTSVTALPAPLNTAPNSLEQRDLADDRRQLVALLERAKTGCCSMGSGRTANACMKKAMDVDGYLPVDEKNPDLCAGHLEQWKSKNGGSHPSFRPAT